MRAVTRMSRWIDTRRPRHLTPGQRASIREHPEYVEAVQRLDEQAEICIYDPSEKMQLQRDKLAREKLNTFGRLERALRQKVRKEFDRKQANIDIERQLSGAAIDNEEAKNVLRTDSMLPEQIDLLEKLFTWPTSHLLKAEWQRRNAAVAAISQYCGHLEGGPLRGRRKRPAPSDEPDEKHPAMEGRTTKPAFISPPEISKEEILLAKAGITFGRPRNLDGAFNVTAIPCCLYIAEHTSIANTNQLCDIFGTSTWRIGDAICAARISYTKCIFADTQKMFIALLPNAITTQKKNQDWTLIRIEAFHCSAKVTCHG